MRARLNLSNSIPKNMRIQLRQNYGTVIIDSVLAGSRLHVCNGTLIVNKTKGKTATSYILINNCRNSEIGKLHNDVIKSKYSTMKLNDANYLDISSSYSHFKINNIEFMSLRSKYDNININTLSGLSLNGRHSNVLGIKLGGYIIMSPNGGNYKWQKIDSNFKDIILNCKMSSIHLPFQDPNIHNLNIALRNCSLKYKDEPEGNEVVRQLVFTAQ